MPALKSAAEPARVTAGTRATKSIRIYMTDLWCFIPYYMFRLCEALTAQSVEPKLGSVRYRLDRDYFRARGMTPDRALLDFAGNIQSAFLRRPIKFLEYITNLLMLAVRLVFSRPDIVHVQYLPFLEMGCRFEIGFLRWVRLLGIKVVYTIHNAPPADGREKETALLRRACGAADALICHGAAAASELVRMTGVPVNRIHVIPHGPLFEDAPAISEREARAELRLEADEPLVLCLGVIDDYKGIPFLLDAWKRAKEAGTPGRLLIAGTGAGGMLDQVRDKVAVEGLADTVRLRLEYVPSEELPLYHMAADVLVYPYKAGTTSGALMTGMNYGKVIVATRLPFFEQYLTDDETALLVNYGDADALASALAGLIRQPQRRQQLANALNRKAIRSVGWDEIAAKTRECYEAVLSGRADL